MDMSTAGAPRQEEDVSKSTTLHEHRARISRHPINPFSKICTRPPSGHTASSPSHPRQVAEERYCVPRMSSSVSCDDCIIVGAQASFAQEHSHGYVEDMDGLASSDGDDLSSLDSADIGELGEAIFQGCQVGPRTSSPGVGGFVGGSYATGHDESEICQNDLNGLETDQSKPDAAGNVCKMSPSSGPVEEKSSLEGVWSKSQPSCEEYGRRCYSGVVPEEAVHPMLEGSISSEFKSVWESEALGISERDAATNIDHLDDERMATTSRSNSLGKSAKGATAQVDEWSWNENQASDVLMLPDTNGCITHRDDLTALVQPYLPISPEPSAQQHDMLSKGATRSGSLRGLLPRPLSMTVYSVASDASRMPSPPPPVLWRGSTGPPSSLEAYTRSQGRILRSTDRWQPHQNPASTSTVNAEALNSPTPSNAGRNLPVNSSPKAPFPTMPKPDSLAVASLPLSFTSVPGPAHTGIKGSTFRATSTLLSLLFHIVPYHLLLV